MLHLRGGGSEDIGIVITLTQRRYGISFLPVFHAKSDYTVRDLKLKIQNQFDIPINVISLYYNEQHLEDDVHLSYCELAHHDSKLYLKLHA